MTTQTPGAAASIRNGQLIDLTTTGRRSGDAKRLEIVIFSFDGRLYISGMPGRRGWLANVVADPRITVHLKGDVEADLPARARVISDLLNVGDFFCASRATGVERVTWMRSWREAR